MTRASVLALVTALLCAGLSNATSNRPIDFLDNLGDASSNFTTIQSLYQKHADAAVRAIFENRETDGVILVPTNAAFASLFDSLDLEEDNMVAEFVNDFLKDHVIQDHPVTGTSEDKNLTAVSGRTVVLTFDDQGRVTMAKPLDSPPDSFAQQSSVLSDPAPWSTTGPGNATLHFIDQVILSQPVYASVIGLRNPASGLWQTRLPGNFSELLQMLPSVKEFEDLLIGDVPHTFFLPNDNVWKNFQERWDTKGRPGFDFMTQIRSTPAFILELLKTYTVKGTVEDGVQVQTLSGKWLRKVGNRIDTDDNPMQATRKLATHHEGDNINGEALEFFNGHTLYSVDNMPMTIELQMGIEQVLLPNVFGVYGAAGMIIPSLMLLLASLAAAAALM